MQVVPFNGTPPVITALRGGEIDAALDIVGPLMPQIAGHALRPLAVLGAQRAPQLPDVPAAREAGGPLARFQRDLLERAGRAGENAAGRGGAPEPRGAAGTGPARRGQKRLLELNQVAQGSTPAQLRERLEATSRAGAR